jgi:hypothetical protein
MISNKIESLSNLTFLAEGGFVWLDRKFEDLNSNGLELTLQDSNSSINSIELGQLGFHSRFLLATLTRRFN